MNETRPEQWIHSREYPGSLSRTPKSKLIQKTSFHKLILPRIELGTNLFSSSNRCAIEVVGLYLLFMLLYQFAFWPAIFFFIKYNIFIPVTNLKSKNSTLRLGTDIYLKPINIKPFSHTLVHSTLLIRVSRGFPVYGLFRYGRIIKLLTLIMLEKTHIKFTYFVFLCDLGVTVFFTESYFVR